MIQKNSVMWNDEYKKDGYLYFAQRIVEMLDHKTIDIYRVPLLNTMRLVDEYIVVDEGHAKKYNLEHILAEFKKSLKSDIVLQNRWGENKIAEVLSYINSKQNQRTKLMKYIKSVIEPQYLNWCLSLAREIIPQAKEKDLIERIIRCLLPELLSKGYAREDVFSFANETFFNDEITPEEALEKFLSFYDCKNKQFSVYLGVKKTLSLFNDVYKKRLNLSFEDDGNFNELHVPENYFVVAKKNVKALDATHAAKIVYKNLELFTSLYQFLGNYSTNLIYKRVFVIDETAKGHVVNANIRKVSSEIIEDRPLAGGIAEMIITLLMKKAECVIPEIERIIQLHNRAIDNIGLENGFLNFWSLLEMVCVSDPDVSHINQVSEILVPILQYSYYNSIFGDLNSNLLEVLGTEAYQRYLGSVAIGDKDYEKLLYIVFLPEYEPLLNDMTDYLLNYPVLRSRLLNFHDRYTNKKDLFSVTEIYAERVKWHLYRIYRARNAISHSGIKPSNLKDLGEHLHSYVDDLIVELIQKLALANLCTISSAIIDCALNFEAISALFSTKTPLDQASLKKLCVNAGNIFYNSPVE